MRWRLSLIPTLLLGLALSSVDSLNIDLNNVITFGGTGYEGIDFGASTVLHKNGKDSWALFGAPKDTNGDGIVSGQVYRCNLSSHSCNRTFEGKQENLRIAGRKYELEAENMSYGLSMAYDFKHERITVCAPRSILSILSSRNATKDLNYFTVGSCTVYTKDFDRFVGLSAQDDLQRPEDFNDHDKFGVLHHVNSMRELGFSVAVKHGRYVLGAPGYQDWSGKSVTYEIAESPYPYSTTPVEMRDSADYVGYSVDHITIGKKDYVVHGAPRRNNVVGEVIIAEHGATQNLKTNIKISGLQTGEYFGAAVAVADVNCDGFDDLLVGAPFHSPTEDVRDALGSVTAKLAKGKYDLGVVYVFLGKENDIDRRHSKILYPDDKSNGGRFGVVITNLGDLDKDRCDDIAVGAPFEGETGAVYIFRGSAKHGVSNDNREKIVPPANGSKVKGFGYSISKGLDVTGNKYLDFAVGAVLSGHGFVYRAQPVVVVRASIQLNEKQIPKEGGNCSVNGRSDLFCVNLNVCASFENPESTMPPQIEDIYLRLDISADAKSSTPRALVGDSKNPRLANNTSARTLPLRAPGRQECIEVKAFVLPASHTQDMLNPIEFRMNYEIDVVQNDPQSFCANCPVLYSKDPVSAATSYKVNCRFEGCVVYLGLRARVEGLENGQAIAIGRTEPLTLKIDVDSDSKSDIAFRTEVVITLESGFTFNNPDKCTRVESDKDTIACTIDNEFEAGGSKSLSLKLQLDPEVALEPTNATFGVYLRTASRDQNAQANNVTFRFPLEYRADAGISGTGLVENVIFKKNSSEINVDHVYTVTKYHESPIDSVELSVLVPRARKVDHLQRYPFVGVFSAETKTSDSSVRVDCTFQNDDRRRIRRESVSVPKSASLTLPTSTVRQLSIDCESFSCRLYKCSIGPLVGDQIRTTFHLQMQLNISELIDQARVVPEVIVFRSDATLILKNRQPLASELNPRPKTASIETVLVREGKPLGRGIAWWWILLAVLVGLVMVLIMFYVLYKCGFFKRNSRDDLTELQKEPQSASPILAPHSPINNMVDVDDNDNNATFHDSKV